MRITDSLLEVLKILLAKPNAEHYLYGLMKATGFPSGVMGPMLLKLQKRGYLVSDWETETASNLGRPRRKYYKLTPAGEQMCREALDRENESE